MVQNAVTETRFFTHCSQCSMALLSGIYGSPRVWGQMYGFLKYKMGNMEGLMNPKNPKVLSEIKICKIGTTITCSFTYV